MSEEREWWRRVLVVPVRPRVAFAGLRDDRPEAVEARQEPILALILLAGVAGILATPAWQTLMDDASRDPLVVAAAAEDVAPVGRELERQHDEREDERHDRERDEVPLVLSLVVLPIEIAAYGGDVFRSGGDDEGAPETIFLLLRLGFVGWTVGLLAVGIQELEAWTWEKVAGAVALSALVLAAALAIPSVL